MLDQMVSPTERRDQQGYWSGTSSFILKLIFFFFLRILYSRHVSVTLTLTGSHMAGPSKNLSSQTSRTNARMHASAVILEIKLTEGSRKRKDMIRITRGIMDRRRGIMDRRRGLMKSTA